VETAAHGDDILFIRMPGGVAHPWRTAPLPVTRLPVQAAPMPEADNTFAEATSQLEPAWEAQGNEPVPPEAPASGRRMVSSALVIMIGQLLSSVLGLVRIETLNVLFWGTASGAFVFALRPIQQVSDLLVGSSVSGALIPTFVDHSDPARREELRRIASTVANLVLILMALAVVALFFLAPTLALIYAPNDPTGARLTTTLIRISALGLFGLGLYAVASALLYALKTVVFPAFATAIQHLGVILGGLAALLIVATQLRLPWSAALTRSADPLIVLLHLEGANGLAVGLALGTLAQVMILLPPLWRLRLVWRPALDLRHPAVRQIIRLYAPIAAGLLISLGQQNAELFLIGRMPGGALQNVTALQSATTLVQFPVGLVTAALSFAVLPPLTAAATRGDMRDFKRTLTLGFRLGLLLMVPAMVGLLALDTPIVSLLFQHGTCQLGCTARNALALQNYAYQLPFLALQQLLIAAFYARKDTITPVVVAILSISFWGAVAVPLAPTMGLPAIAFANTALNSGQAIVLFVLLTRQIGNPGVGSLLSGLARIGLAAAAMWGVCWTGMRFLPALAPHLFTLADLHGQALTVVVIGGAASVVYFALVALLRLEEVRMVGEIVRTKFNRK